MVFVKCNTTWVVNDHGQKLVRKDMLGWIVVVADFFVIIAFQMFTYAMEQGQENYVNQFRDDTLEITDFAIRVKNVPHNMSYGDSDINLQGYLMTHFH